MQTGFTLAPEQTLESQSPDDSGTYTYPSTGPSILRLPVAGIIYFNVTGNDCEPTPARPAGRIIKRQNYYGFRPARTYLYGEFDHRTWTAYVGMGNETSGVALGGTWQFLRCGKRGKGETGRGKGVCRQVGWVGK